MKAVLKRVGGFVATMLITPFMMVYLIGGKIVQGAKWLINKIK